ncbi:MAG TPA: helix-turn-helix domain-containing protein [Spirochaetota bacterium]|nr:AraC family transcriptional regulator [Spirochaetota bacterium]HOW83791.1 helix-turn-helix domain-containing protein [Spirochaetota bacterium]
MTTTHIIMAVIIISGVVLGVFTAIEHITGHSKNRRSYFRFVRGLIVSLLMGQLAVIGFGLYERHPSLLFLFFTFLYISGPLDHIRYHALVYSERKTPLTLKIPFLPLIPLLALELFLLTLHVDRKHAIYNEFFRDPLDHRLVYVLFACLAVYITYSGIILYNEIVSLRQSDNKRPLLFSILMSGIVIVSTGVACLFFITLDREFILLGASGISFQFIIYFLFKNRFSDFFKLFVREMRQTRYKRTIIKGIDQRAVNERLAELMEQEKLYRDMDLRMKDVAERLLLTPHQFSRLVNENIKTDFRNYVNTFRVREAMRLLVERPERSIITICFEVGFSSKTSFNVTFKKMTGLSPKEYREKNSV